MNPGLNGKRKETAHLRVLWNVVQRNRWLAFGVPVLVIAATAAFVAWTTPIYDASVTLRIDEEGQTLPILDALKSLSTGSKMDTEMEVLRSRTLAELAVDSLALA
ncbi:MAG TPA: Wzz/FepE/Etk N-terminal domain-containing protein, partial [Longimicrobiales bacterium]